ncbi:MAG TPA: PQQ-binding-like beta-propeller repeat protein [Chitinophagales bacterium]|nr:PQQ-binding-like beta-propeller repeat protein [Chitinophagales bacterium]
MKICYCFISAVLLLCSCKEEELLTWDPYEYPEDPEPPNELIWQVPLHQDTLGCLATWPQIYQNAILCSGEEGWENPVRVFAVDTSGNLMWESNAVFNENCSSISASVGTGAYQYQNMVAMLCNADPRVVNIQTGEVMWHYEVPGSGNHSPYMSGFGDQIFHAYADGPNPYTKSYIARANIYTGIWDTVFSIEMVDGYSADLYPPGAWVDNNGDTIICFQNRQWRNPPYDGKVDLYAYNLTADSLLWMYSDIDPDGNSSVFPPVYADGKVFFRGYFHVYGLDAKTGNLIWTWASPNVANDLLYTNTLVVDDKVLVKTTGPELFALDPDNGSEIWHTSGFGEIPSELEAFDGMLYFSTEIDGKLNAVNIQNGSLEWTMTSPNHGQPTSSWAYFSRPVTIDPLLRRLYLTDFFYLLCIQLK